MEMSTLTTNSIQEQFLSTTEQELKEPELNNNNIIILSDTTVCANNSTATTTLPGTGTTITADCGTSTNCSIDQPRLSNTVPVDVPVPVVADTNESLLLPPLIEMPSDPNQGNEMLQNLPKDTSISFPDVSAQTLDENQDVKLDLPGDTDSTSLLLNPNAAPCSSTDPLRTPPRTMIEDRSSVTDQYIPAAPPAASAPPVVTVEPSELEPVEVKDGKEENPPEGDVTSATNVKQEPNETSMTDQMEKFDEKVEGLIRLSRLNGSSPTPNDVHHQSTQHHHQRERRSSSTLTATNGSSGYHHQQMTHHQQMHPVPVSRPPVGHPYGGHHYFPRAIPSHVSDHPSSYPITETSGHGLHHHQPHRYSSSIGQVPFHHQSSISEDDEREEATPSPESKDSALNLAMNAAYQQQHHHQSQQHFLHVQSSSVAPGFSHHLQQQQQQQLVPPGTVHHHQGQGHFQAHHQQPMSHGHFPLPPHHQLPPGRNPYHSTAPPPLISSLASSMSRHSGNGHLTYNQANSHGSMTSDTSFQQMMGQHLPPPNHHPFADLSISAHHPSHHGMGHGHGYRVPTSIPVSVVTSLSEIRRKQGQGLVNPVTQFNTLTGNGSSVQEYKFVDQNKSDNMRANNSSITVKTRTALPSSVISTGTRSSARTNTVTGVHEGGGGGITGSNDLVSVISGQPSGPAGGVSCTPHQTTGSNHNRVAPMPVIGPRPPPVPSGNPAKPFKCSLCNKELASKNVYQLHLRSHNGERPFACNLCGNAFSQKTSLTRHMRSHTGERPYPCTRCEKRFADKERIKIHMRTHTGEKPFSCEVCDKRFSQKSTVKRHMSVHTGAKPYKCPQCDKGFANRGNLTAHTKTHQPAQVVPSATSTSGHRSNLVPREYLEPPGDQQPVRMSRCPAAGANYMIRHPSGSSNQSMSSSEASEHSATHTNGSASLIIVPDDSSTSHQFHVQDTQGSNSSQSCPSAVRT